MIRQGGLQSPSRIITRSTLTGSSLPGILHASTSPTTTLEEVRSAGGRSTGYWGGWRVPPPVSKTSCVDPDAIRQHLEIIEKRVVKGSKVVGLGLEAGEWITLDTARGALAPLTYHNPIHINWLKPARYFACRQAFYIADVPAFPDDLRGEVRT